MKKFSNAFLVSCVVFLLFSFRIDTSTVFAPDIARDMFDIWNIAHGDYIRLLGPKLSFGGLFSGPYYYYLFLIPLMLAGGHLIGMLLFEVLLSALCTGYIFYVLQDKTKNAYLALGGTVWIAVSPYFLLAARHPGNAYTYVPLLVAFLLHLLLLPRSFNFSMVRIVIYGLITGFILSFHPITVLALIPVWIFVIIQNYKNLTLKKYLTFFIGMTIALSPLLIFEMTHGFVMLKNTFLEKSYTKFVLDKGLYYYGFPLIALVQTAAITFFIRQKNNIYRWIFGFIVVMAVIQFPGYLYVDQLRTFSYYKNAYARMKQRITLPKNNVNVLQIDNKPEGILGYPVRYLLALDGIQLALESQYSSSKYLLIADETKKTDISKLKNWEVDEFGHKKKINEYNDTYIFWYLFEEQRTLKP